MSTAHPVPLDFYDRDDVDGYPVGPAAWGGRQRRTAAVPARRGRTLPQAPADQRPGPEGRPPRLIPPLTAVIPTSAADAVHDAAHATAARFRQGAYSLPCPECRVPAGMLCLARRMHTARRDAYRRNPAPTGPVPLPGRVRDERLHDGRSRGKDRRPGDALPAAPGPGSGYDGDGRGGPVRSRADRRRATQAVMAGTTAVSSGRQPGTAFTSQRV